MNLSKTMRALNPDAFAPSPATAAASAKRGRNLEREHQQRVIAWLNQKGVKRVGIQRTDKKATGIKGWPDLTFVWGDYKGRDGDWRAIPCVIEMKVKPNKPSQEQLDCLLDMRSDGWQTFVAYSDGEAINWILSL